MLPCCRPRRYRHVSRMTVVFFFFNDTATTEIYTLSLHDALPISALRLAALETEMADLRRQRDEARAYLRRLTGQIEQALDRKSTRLNSSHANISYAVFCLKKKNAARFAIGRAQVLTTDTPISRIP